MINAKPPQPLMQLVYARTGLGKALLRQVTFIHMWAMAEQEAGHRLTAEEYAITWAESRTTAYRRLEEFRRVFPELGPHGKPDALYVWRERATEPEWGLQRGMAT